MTNYALRKAKSYEYSEQDGIGSIVFTNGRAWGFRSDGHGENGYAGEHVLCKLSILGDVRGVHTVRVTEKGIESPDSKKSIADGDFDWPEKGDKVYDQRTKELGRSLKRLAPALYI